MIDRQGAEAVAARLQPALSRVAAAARDGGGRVRVTVECGGESASFTGACVALCAEDVDGAEDYHMGSVMAFGRGDRAADLLARCCMNLAELCSATLRAAGASSEEAAALLEEVARELRAGSDG